MMTMIDDDNDGKCPPYLKYYSHQQVSGTVNWSQTTLITFDKVVTCVIFDLNSVI